MSETRHVICHRCGSVVLEGLSRLTAEAGPVRAAGYVHIDLCKDCGPQLVDWLRSRAPALAR